MDALFLGARNAVDYAGDFVVQLALAGPGRWFFEGVGHHHRQTTLGGFILDASLLEHTTSSRAV